MSFGTLGYERNLDPDTEVALYRNGVRNLRGGLGAIYVKAAGNGFRKLPVASARRQCPDRLRLGQRRPHQQPALPNRGRGL